MSALPRPDLPPGAHRDLVDALHDLHHRAGWPSLRTLARDAGCSHTTVSKTFSAPAVPTWGTLELLVEAMAGDTGKFHALWLAATTPGKGTPTPRIAGRKAELAAVRRHLETGHGLLLITGEAGIGKTTVLNGAAESATALAAAGSCLPLSRQVPYLPIAEALRVMYEVDGGQRFRAVLAECPPYVARELARLVPEIDSTTVDAGTGELARQRLIGGLQSFLTTLASAEPTAVLLDDLHWADANTLDLLEHLVSRHTLVPLVGTWRLADPTTDTVNTEWFTRVRRLPGVTEVLLGPLTRAETSEQLALHPAEVDADAVYSRSKGHPLFTAQLAAHDATGELPSLLADLLDVRLGDLAGAAWSLARALGVADRPLELDVLAAAAGLDRATAVTGLRTLAARQLLDHASVSRTAGLGHPLLAEAVRRRLVPGEGTDQHRALAEALAACDGREPAEIAAHWQAADDSFGEAPWRIAAARAAAARFDARQEAEQWLRTLDIWPGSESRIGEPPVSRPEVYLAAMDALQTSFQWDRAAEMSDAAGVELGQVDDAVRAELLRRAAEFRGGRDGLPTGLALVDQALALYRRLPPSRGTIRALGLKDAFLRRAGDYDGAREVARTMAEVSASVGEPSLQRWAMMRFAWYSAAAGDLGEALLSLTAADALCPPGSDPHGDLQRAVVETDVLLVCGGTAEEVLAAGRPGMAVAHDLDIDNPLLELLLHNVACALIRAGRVAEAAALVRSDPPPTPATNRWLTHLIGAVVDALRGRLDVAATSAETLWQLMAARLTNDLEFIVLAGIIDTWNQTPENTLPRVLHALDLLVDGTPIRLLAPALVTAARAAADVAAAQGSAPPGCLTTLRDLHARAGLGLPAHRNDMQLRVHARTWDLELTRMEGAAPASSWVDTAALWDRLGRPHDAAYCRWRAAQVALREGQGTVAARLLKRAATDAREHVPLNRAVAATIAGVQ